MKFDFTINIPIVIAVISLLIAGITELRSMGIEIKHEIAARQEADKATRELAAEAHSQIHSRIEHVDQRLQILIDDRMQWRNK